MTFTEEEYIQLQREYLQVHKEKKIEGTTMPFTGTFTDQEFRELQNATKNRDRIGKGASMPRMSDEECMEIQKQIDKACANSHANSHQEGGDHYQKVAGEQHWDRIWRLYGAGYFVGCISKYLERYHLKDGIRDLLKARHYLDKLIELEQQKVASDNTGSPNVDDAIHLSIGWEEGQYTVACGIKDPKVSNSNQSSVTCKKCLEVVKGEKVVDNVDNPIHLCIKWEGGHYTTACGVEVLKSHAVNRSNITCKKCLETLEKREQDERNKIIHYNYQYDGQHYITSCGIEDPKLSTHNQSKVTCEKCIEALKKEDEQNDDNVTHYWEGEHHATACGIKDPVLHTINMSEVTCEKCFEIVKGEKHDS